MRKAKPPVGWERAKNCFPVPNELLCFDLPAGAVAVYIYLLRHADRRTNQCYPSEATMARDLHLARNTVAKYVRLLEWRNADSLLRSERRYRCETASEKTAVCAIPSFLCMKSWDNAINGSLPKWNAAGCSDSWQHRPRNPHVHLCEPLCDLLRGGVASLPPEKDFGPFLGRFSGASPALRRTKTEAGERHWRFSAPTLVTAARSADCHEGLQGFENDADYRTPNVLWRYSL